MELRMVSLQGLAAPRLQVPVTTQHVHSVPQSEACSFASCYAGWDLHVVCAAVELACRVVQCRMCCSCRMSRSAVQKKINDPVPADILALLVVWWSYVTQ